MIQTLLLNTDQFPVKERHVAFTTREGEGDISLIEVFEAFYPHPQTEGGGEIEVLISRLETRMVRTEKMNSARAAAIHLVKFADDNAKNSI